MKKFNKMESNLICDALVAKIKKDMTKKDKWQ